MLEKTFDPKTAEPRLYAAWEASGAFGPEPALARDPEAEPFCMVIPPPNVTGSLHVGHALNNTLQDILARFHRMRGAAVLWVPGVDHAGIATQMVVERQLAAEGGMGRRDMGRDAFVERVWAWKAQSGGVITQQLRRLGASCDWSRERFTLDEGLSRAVRKVFVELHRKGLIYRAKRLVKLGSATSDRALRHRGRDPRSARQDVALRLSLGGRADRRRDRDRHRHDSARDHAGRWRRGGAPGRSALHPVRGAQGSPADRRSPDPHHRRRIPRPGKGLRRGENHRRPRFQRLPSGPAP